MPLKWHEMPCEAWHHRATFRGMRSEVEKGSTWTERRLPDSAPDAPGRSRGAAACRRAARPVCGIDTADDEVHGERSHATLYSVSGSEQGAGPAGGVGSVRKTGTDRAAGTLPATAPVRVTTSGQTTRRPNRRYYVDTLRQLPHEVGLTNNALKILSHQ
jgi:hypothetical protein